MNDERITTLKNENIVWILYILFAIAGIKANNLEIEDIKMKNNKNKRKYKTINIVILIIALFIYLYFINLTYNRYKKNNKKEKIENAKFNSKYFNINSWTYSFIC